LETRSGRAQIKLVGQAESFMSIKAEERGWIVIDRAATADVVKNDDFDMILIPADLLSQIVRCCWLSFLRIPFSKSVSRPFSNFGVPRIGLQCSETI